MRVVTRNLEEEVDIEYTVHPASPSVGIPLPYVEIEAVWIGEGARRRCIMHMLPESTLEMWREDLEEGL